MLITQTLSPLLCLDEIQFPRLSNESSYLHSIYEFNYQLDSSNLDKYHQDGQLQANEDAKHYYSTSQPNHESTYLTLLNVQNSQPIGELNSELNQQVNNNNSIDEISSSNQINSTMNEINGQMNQQVQQDNQITGHQITNQIGQQNTQQPSIASNSSPSKFQYQQPHVHYINNSIQTQPTSLPSVASLKNAENSASNLTANLDSNLSNNLNNVNITINSTININANTNLNANHLQSNLNSANLNNANLSILHSSSPDLANPLSSTTLSSNALSSNALSSNALSSNQQLELNNSTNTTIKMNANCLNGYYQAEQLHHSNQLTYHHHVQQSNRQFISNKNANFTIDSNHQLTSSPSSISSSSNSSNSSPLPSLSSPALSPDSMQTIAGDKKVVVRTSKHGRNSTRNIQLWQFLKELLNQPHLYENCIKWINRKEGEFRIVNSVLVANLWGKRKNRPKMNYDKLSRSIRQYYKKNIMIKTTKSQRLVYKFVGDYMK